MALLVSLSSKPNHYLSLSSLSILTRTQPYNSLRVSNSTSNELKRLSFPSNIKINNTQHTRVFNHPPFVLSSKPSLLTQKILFLNCYSNRYFSTDSQQQQQQTTTAINEISEISEISGVNEVNEVSDLVTTIASSGDEVVSHEPGFLSSIVSPLFENFHIYTGLPWWATICSVVLIVRLALFFPFVLSTRSAAKIQKIQPQVEEIKKKYAGDPHSRSRSMAEMGELYRREKVNPFGILGAFPQIPVFLGMMYSLTDLPKLIPEMKTGGLWWFLDLSLPDSYYILPTITALIFIPTLQLSLKRGPTNNFMSNPKVLWVLRGAVLVAIPFSSYFPASVTLLWVSNSIFTFLQQYIIGLEKVRNYFGIPPITRSQSKPGDILILPKRGKVNTEQLTEVNKRYNITEQTTPPPQIQPPPSPYFNNSNINNQNGVNNPTPHQDDSVKKERKRRR